MSDTPRTDAVDDADYGYNFDEKYAAMKTLARQLESELETCKDEISNIAGHLTIIVGEATRYVERLDKLA